MFETTNQLCIQHVNTQISKMCMFVYILEDLAVHAHFLVGSSAKKILFCMLEG